ncbi:MAG: hypothetical protein ACYDBJ_05355 [Aggregatilineales bacterium]
MIDLLFGALQILNEVITATTVIIAASLAFYNLSHGIRDRVVRTSSLVLGCVIVVYISDVFLALGRANPSAHVEAWLRISWIGIAFIPATLFHLSDALLETTGIVSRGRRRRVLRLLYLYGVVFLLTATGTDLIVRQPARNPFPTMHAGPLWPLYLLYFGLTVAVSFNNVLRARRRCLTPVTHRRMTYLLLTFLMPAVGIFPYTLLIFPSPDHALLLLILVDLGNIAIAFMLAFMSYPLAFFGQNRPDRVIKGELLRFLLRGPLTGIVVLSVILFMPAITRALALPGADFLPFVAVASVLLVQWGIALALPILDRRLVYASDHDQAQQLQAVSDRLLTPADARQQFETILAAVCDYLRTPSAFIVSFGAHEAKLESVIGSLHPAQTWLSSPEFMTLADPDAPVPEGMTISEDSDLIAWQSFWIMPLRNVRHPRQVVPTRTNGTANVEQQNDATEQFPEQIIGALGVWARAPQIDLTTDEQLVFEALCRRAARVLSDMRLQGDIFSILQGLLPEMDALQRLRGPARYGNAPALAKSDGDGSTPLDSSELAHLIHEALRDYWGGPGLTESRLLALNVVKRALAQNDDNQARAIRAVLSQAIESLRPEGPPRKTADWTLYNVLNMRFVQGRKASEVAESLAMSEASIYRKQGTAIAQVAARVEAMEHDGHS